MTGLEIVGALIGLIAMAVPLILKGIQNRKANRNEIGKAEAKELGDAMARVDRDKPD